MQIRRLSTEDYYHLEELVSIRVGTNKFFSDFVTNKDSATEDDQLEYKKRWLAGMLRWYLTPNDTHDLYGAFLDDGTLVSCMSWRSDLPAPWNDGWVVGNLKSRPGYSFRTNGILLLWTKMFEICEAKGLKRWHMVIVEDNKNRYQAVADRYFKDIDSSYSYDWTFIIPPDTQPSEDWVWGTMGRTLLNKEIRVRTGTKK
jgi:hypothetical protein